MAADHPIEAFLSYKLTFLKDRGDVFIRTVGHFVNEIIAVGESWTEKADNKVGYLELCQRIDSAVLLLCEKSEEFSGASDNVATNQLFSDALGFSGRNAERVAEQQQDIDHQLTEVLLNLSDSDKKTTTKFRKLKEQISEINDNHVALNQEHEARLESLEKQLKKLNATQVEMQSETEMTEKLVHVPDQLDSVKDDLDVLEAKIGKIIDDCSKKHQDIERVTRDLEDNIMAVSERVQVISDGQDQKTTLLRELETRLQTLEADSGRNMNGVQKQFRILCQMLNDRLTPLEQLRTCLNQRASTRDENVKKLSQVIQEMTVMSPRFEQLELKFSRTRCGFTAVTEFSGQVAGDTIKPYTTTLSNVGGNFNANSGIFTAPVDGLYVASVSLDIGENEALEVSARYKVQGQGHSSGDDVCWCSSIVKDTQACNMGVVDMKAGDTLYLHLVVGETSYLNTVWFSCFLLA